MEQSTHRLYHNKTGIAFMWKKPDQVLAENIQLIFRDIGFYFTFKEMQAFYQCIQRAKKGLSCDNCAHQSTCRSILLQTPITQVDLAVSTSELMGLYDLVNGTLFKIQLESYVKNTCHN